MDSGQSALGQESHPKPGLAPPSPIGISWRFSLPLLSLTHPEEQGGSASPGPSLRFDWPWQLCMTSFSPCHSLFGMAGQVPPLQSVTMGSSSSTGLAFGGESCLWRPRGGDSGQGGKGID